MSQKPAPVDATVAAVPAPEPKLGFVANFRAKHPRLVKALAITGGLLVVGGGVYAAGKKSSSSPSVEIYDDGFDGTVQVTDSTSED